LSHPKVTRMSSDKHSNALGVRRRTTQERLTTQNMVHKICIQLVLHGKKQRTLHKIMETGDCPLLWMDSEELF